MVTYSNWMLHTRTMNSCNKAKALVDWIYWYTNTMWSAFRVRIQALTSGI